METSLDLLIIGAGISGIVMGCAARRQGVLTFEIVDKREAVGGTWDIFCYPGVRSDSDMDSYAFSFAEFRGTRPLGTGEEIRQYLTDVVCEYGLDQAIRFGVKVEKLRWDEEGQLWEARTNDGSIWAKNVHVAGGYFNHERGYLPDFPAQEEFRGRVIHPQNWPEDVDWAGKNVVVIGSGATAASIVPALAETAKVTMLQRSPSHMAAMASHARKGPVRRLRAVAMNQLIVEMANRTPRLLNWALDQGRSRILPAGQRAHFRPTYPVWDQRVCRIPDGDLFKLIADHKVGIVTDTIARFTPDGVQLSSGTVIPADIVVTATGLELQALGGIEVWVGDRRIELGRTPAYRGCMLRGVPNLSFTMGYVNESFTLRAELVADYVLRAIAWAKGRGGIYLPQGEPKGAEVPIIDLKSGYVQRGIDQFPYVTDKEPYALYNDHFKEAKAFRSNRFEDVEGAISIRTKLSGPADGEPVVLLHGIGRRLEDYDRLAIPGKRLIALDTPGFGRTQGLAQPSMDAIARVLWKAVESHTTAKVTLCGNSLGGNLAMRMALLRPEQVKDVVLLAPSGFGEDITSAVAIAATSVGPAFVKATGGVLLKTVEQKVLGTETLIDQHYLDVAQACAANPDHVRTFVTLSRELVAVPRERRMDVAKAFSRLQIPTRVLWGTSDAVLPVTDVANVSELIPHAQVEILPDTGHILPLVAPARVCEALLMT